MNWNSLGQNLTPNTTEEMNYQNAIKTNFNMIVPANAGKWQNNEFTQNSVNMSMVDAMNQFASQNGLRVRMHNLIWDNQQPSFVNSQFNSSNGTVASPSTLTADINSRISYYVSGKNANSLNIPRTDNYTEMDVLNEAWHGLIKPSSTTTPFPDYIASALGVSGVAGIYANVGAAVAAAGANTRLMTNEFNVLQFSPQTISLRRSHRLRSLRQLVPQWRPEPPTRRRSHRRRRNADVHNRQQQPRRLNDDAGIAEYVRRQGPQRQSHAARSH